MPYSANNPPKVAKNWTREEQGKCIKAANAALRRGSSEQDAIFACIAAAGKSKKQEGRMTTLQEVWGKVKEAFFPFVEEKDVQEGGGRSVISRTKIRQMEDGKFRAFSISAVAAKNRVGEIDSRDLFDSFKKLADTTGEYPQRDFMHLGRYGDPFIVGDVDFMARSGNVFITSTLYRDNELARAEIAARQANPDDWGDSIAYVPLKPGMMEREGNDVAWVSPKLGFLNFVSTVPERLAASHFTMSTIGEVDRMSLKEEELKAFAALFGDEEKASEFLSRHVGDIEAAIADADMMTRSIDEEEEPADPPAESETQDEVEFEVGDDFIDIIVQRTAQVLHTQLEQLEAAIAALKDDVTSLLNSTNDRHAEVTDRLQALEVDEAEKHQKWTQDLPRKTRASVTYRPRDDSGDEPPTYADQAREVVEGWADVRDFYGQS